jgi:hypothetical protein
MTEEKRILREESVQLSYVYNRTVLALRSFSSDSIPPTREDVTEQFLRCVVRYCTEEVEFVVDGMRFKATCEMID